MFLCTWIRTCARGKLQVLSKFNTLSCLAKRCLTSGVTPSHIHWVFSLMALSLLPAAQRRLSKILLFSASYSQLRMADWHLQPGGRAALGGSTNTLEMSLPTGRDAQKVRFRKGCSEREVQNISWDFGDKELGPAFPWTSTVSLSTRHFM